MKIYITSPFREGRNKDEIERLCAAVRLSGFEDFSFIRDIEQYQKTFQDPHELMTRAKEEIEKCDALLIDYNGAANGRMIELGIAYALNKKILLIAQQGTNVKETVIGVTDATVLYDTLEDIIEPLSALCVTWGKNVISE